jgi:hypothetical protein
MIFVFDDVLPDPAAYRAEALAQSFGDFEDPDAGAIFHSVARAPGAAILDALRSRFPSIRPTLSFFRRSPLGQREQCIVSDGILGDWSSVLFLNREPPPLDGISFWKHRPTGRIRGTWNPATAADRAQWLEWMLVGALFNRLIIFPADYFHSLALEADHGQGDDTGLVQVTFGVGALTVGSPYEDGLIVPPLDAATIH